MITIVMSSFNRVGFVDKFVKNLFNQKFEGQLIIGDASSSENHRKIKELTDKYKDKIDILLEWHHKMNVQQSIKKILAKIKYDYCTWLPDDDFPVVDTLIYCKNFLEENQDHSAAGGVILFYSYENYFNTYAILKQKNLIQEKAYDRVKFNLLNYEVVHYSLHRKSQFIYRYQNIPDEVSFIDGAENIDCHLLCALGKIKFFDKLFVVRTLHDNRYSLGKNINQFFEDNWKISFSSKLNLIYKTISDVDKISLDKKQSENIKKYLIKHYEMNIYNDFKKEKNNFFKKLKNSLKKFLLNKKNVKVSIYHLKKYIFPKKHIKFLDSKKFQYKSDFEKVKKVL